MKVKTSPEEKPKKRGGIQPRNRTKYSAAQLNAMESLFLVSQYPDSSTIEDLSKSLSVSIERISIWFQNRRSKFKRQSKDVHMAWMRKQIFNQSSQQQQQTPFMGLPRPQVMSQSPPDNRHVLSPPEEAKKQEPVVTRPRTNLHYMPMMSTSVNMSAPISPPLPATSTTTFPSLTQSISPSGQFDSATSSTYAGNPLLMSHLLNDVNQASSSSTTGNGYQFCNYSNGNHGIYNGGYSYYQQMNSYYPMSSHEMYSTSS